MITLQEQPNKTQQSMWDWGWGTIIDVGILKSALWPSTFGKKSAQISLPYSRKLFSSLLQKKASITSSSHATQHARRKILPSPKHDYQFLHMRKRHQHLTMTHHTSDLFYYLGKACYQITISFLPVFSAITLNDICWMRGFSFNNCEVHCNPL